MRESLQGDRHRWKALSMAFNNVQVAALQGERLGNPEQFTRDVPLAVKISMCMGGFGTGVITDQSGI